MSLPSSLALPPSCRLSPTLRYATLTSLRSEYDANLRRHEELSRRYAPDELLTTLRIAMQQADEAADAVSQQFQVRCMWGGQALLV